MKLYSTLARLRVLYLSLTDGHYRTGRDWWRRLTRMEPAAVESAQMQLLRGLIEEFVRLGLLRGSLYAHPQRLARHSDLSALPVQDREAMVGLLPLVEQVFSERSDLILKRSSGSTGAPVRYLREKSLDRMAEGFYNEMYRLSGWKPGVYRIGLWGNYSEFGGESRPQGSRSRLMHKWVISTFAPTAEHFRLFHAEIMANPRSAVFGYASVVAEACRVLRSEGLLVPQAHVLTCFTGAETLTPAMRRDIEEYMHCRVHDGYSSRESEHMSLQCRQGTRHVNPRYIFEALRLDSNDPCAPGESGRLLVTDLFNRITPHVRYEIGDIGSVAWSECPCGVKGQVLSDLQGKFSNFVRFEDGRSVSTLFFSGLLQERNTVDEFQIVRRTERSFLLRYRGVEIDAAEEAEIQALARGILGDVDFELQRVEELPRTSGGKWRYYIDERSSSNAASSG